MNVITRKNYKNLCGTLENIFREDANYTAIAAEAKNESAKLIVMKDDGIDIKEASNMYTSIIKNKLIPYLNTIELPKEKEEVIDIQEVSDMEKGQTLFGMQPINDVEVSVNSPEEVVDAADQVMSLNYDLENTTMIPDIATTPIYANEDESSEALEEVSEIEEKQVEKVKSLGKKAAYVDTVILCLIAQLSIFGLLILVLLIIK
jgi:hypothetical protein